MTHWIFLAPSSSPPATEVAGIRPSSSPIPYSIWPGTILQRSKSS
jgi:hypothetical protein